MDDTFRLDLAGYDRGYIEKVLAGFIGDAPDYGRRVSEIRLAAAMAEKLGLANSPAARFRGVAVMLADTGFDDTIEIVLAPAH